MVPRGASSPKPALRPMTTKPPSSPPRPLSPFDNLGPVVFPPRLVAAIKPAAVLHLGHYFGAIRQQIQLHHQYPGQSFVCVTDYLALPTLSPAEVRRRTLDVACAYVALGLDPRKSTLYRQSDVPQVTELAIILSGLPALSGDATRPALSRDVALAAADLLAVRGTLAPVGPDARPMVLAVRDIADRFNKAYDRLLFPLPEPVTTLPAPLPGTDGHKMSASVGNVLGVFSTFGPVGETLRRLEPGPAAAPLPPLLELLPGEPGDPSAPGIERLAVAIDRAFAPARDRYGQWKNRPDEVEDILRDGGRRAREEAAETLDKVRSLVGLSSQVSP